MNHRVCSFLFCSLNVNFLLWAGFSLSHSDIFSYLFPPSRLYGVLLIRIYFFVSLSLALILTSFFPLVAPLCPPLLFYIFHLHLFICSCPAGFVNIIFLLPSFLFYTLCPLFCHFSFVRLHQSPCSVIHFHHLTPAPPPLLLSFTFSSPPLTHWSC